MRARPMGRGPPRRSERRRIARWDPPPDGARSPGQYPPLAGNAAPSNSAMPGLPSSPGISNSEGDDARVRWQDAVYTHWYLRSLAFTRL
jgi:hypothetical protein